MSDRRTVLKVITVGAGGVLAAAAVVPAAALVMEPGQSASADAGTWTRVVRLDDLAIGHAHKANVIGARVDAWMRAPDQRLGSVWLLRESETVVRAYSAACPHLGCPIEHNEDRFECPCHDAVFTQRGQRVSGPARRGMDALEVRITDGWVAVRYQRFRQGVPDRVPV